MADDLLSVLLPGGPSSTAVVDGARAGRAVTRGELLAAIARISADAATHADDGRSLWISTSDRAAFVAAATAGLGLAPTALVEVDGPPAAFAQTADVCPPSAVLSDSPGSGAVRWAQAAGVPVVFVTPPGPGPAAPDPPSPAMDGIRLQVFTSGTSGPVKCVDVPGPQLRAAVDGVADRLGLGPEDVSLSVAPLTHTLGYVTSVLAAWSRGGGVVLADPTRSAELLGAVTAGRPTWCAAAPGLLWLVGRTTSSVDWPDLRLVRASAAPMSDELADELEDRFQVPLITAYAMSEAPGEIASQPLTERLRGTVGRPTLCQVRIRAVEDAPDAMQGGQVWVRGPNVVERGADGAPAWFATGDLGLMEPSGHLRLTGRVRDMINMGGLKIWPREVEAAALRQPGIVAAAAFAVPHRRMGERVGLAVVPGPGSDLDPPRVRRMLMSQLQREKWPAHVVVCDRIPLTGRGKVDRRRLVRMAEG